MTPAVSTRDDILAAEADRDGMWTTSSTTTPVVPGVYGCIVKVSGGLAAAGIAKDGRNVQQNYAFRGIDAVMNALAPMLVKHGLVILPRCLSRDVVERQTQKGGTLFYVTVEAEFDFVCAADGSTHTVRMFGEAMDSADKATNKAMSAAYKYAAFQTFCIPTEGEDADATTPDEVLPTPGRDASPPARDAAYRPSAGNGGDSQHSNLAPAPPRTAILPHRVERKNAVAAPAGERAAPSDRPEPPYGYVYIDSYAQADNGWHDVKVGRTKYSTKTAVGRIAGEAFEMGRPVKIESKPKENSPGEHWLNGVTVWTEEARRTDDDIPF